MYKYYPLILGIMDTLEEWNKKLNSFTGEHMDNAIVGAVVVIVLLAIGCWGINELNKK